jgi:Cu/Ag efflux protein CusF
MPQEGSGMRGAKVFMAMAAAGALAFGTGIALAANEAPKAAKAVTSYEAGKPVMHRVRGEVTAVEPGARTMTVKAMEGKEEVTVGVDVTDKTVIRQAKAHKTLGDIKVGDRVWMKYERTNDKLVAQAIHILKPQHMAAKQ